MLISDAGLGCGLPLIPFVLIASRTKIFDSVLPVLPVIFFCHNDPLHLTLPLSPRITLALLPYIRSLYNSVWDTLISPYEQQWIKETTPKFQIENQEAQERQRIQRQRRADANANRRRNNRQPQEAAQAAAEAADVDAEMQWEGEVRIDNHNILFQGNNITSMILGALLWPTIAKLIGQSLGRIPALWGGERLRKLLPSPLARNVAGGLMVVMLKVWIFSCLLHAWSDDTNRTSSRCTASTREPKSSAPDRL